MGHAELQSPWMVHTCLAITLAIVKMLLSASEGRTVAIARRPAVVVSELEEFNVSLRFPVI
jgi:hypothetical protein